MMIKLMEINMFCDECGEDVFAIVHDPENDTEAECTKCYSMVKITDEMLEEIYEKMDQADD